ncbi:hypothetical protein MHTCC0001_18490 [Flavobacteriaceae bacterium MHTCC 0001]
MHAQQKSYEFNRLNTRKQTLKGQTTSEIFAVFCPKTNQYINPEYTKLELELERAIVDSVTKSTVYLKAANKYKDISTIKSKVVAFIKSSEPFTNKLKLLKEAQILALKHNLKYLFYSDNSINKTMKAGFILLKLKPESMDAHLKKTLQQLDKLIKMPKQPDYQYTAVLRGQLSSISKFKDTEKPEHKKGYMLQHIVAPEDIAGAFTLVGAYFVLKAPANGFSRNQLISKKAVLNYQITKNKLSSSITRALIQNKETKEMYLVDDSFLQNFSIKS